MGDGGIYVGGHLVGCILGGSPARNLDSSVDAENLGDETVAGHEKIVAKTCLFSRD